MQNNINFDIPNENNIIHADPSHEVSLDDVQIKKEIEVLSNDKQISSNEAKTETIPLGTEIPNENSPTAVDYATQNVDQLGSIPLIQEGNQLISNTNTDNFNVLGENINGEIPQTSGNQENVDFLQATSEQYNTEEIAKVNSPKVFTTKNIDDSKNLLSSYSIGHTAVESSPYPLTDNLITTTGDLQTANYLENNADNKLENEINPQNIDSSVKQSTDFSKNANIDPKLLSNPKIAELVKKYRTEVVVEPREEVKYIPVKKVKYVKILKVYVPKVKKVYVPGKKVVVPVKKKVYVPRPKNLQSSQMPSKLSTSTNPIMTTSTLSTRTNNFNNPSINRMTQSINSSINKMTQSINTNVNNSQTYGINSIYPSTSVMPIDKSLTASTKVIEIPLSSSNSTSNILQSSTNFGPLTGRSAIFNYSYAPRIYSRSLSRNKDNQYDEENFN